MERVFILRSDSIQRPIIDAHSHRFVFLFTNNTFAPQGDILDLIQPFPVGPITVPSTILELNGTVL